MRAVPADNSSPTSAAVDTPLGVTGFVAAGMGNPFSRSERGAFGPITAIRTMQPPMPLMDFIPMVGALPAGGMSYINSELNKIPKV